MKQFIFVLVSLFALSSTAGMSAARHTDETYETARDRHFEHALKTEASSVWGNTAETVKAPLNQIDFSHIPDVGSYADLEREFQYIRDTRFITSFNPEFPRRATWLFPDDGCYARAQIAGMELTKHNFPSPKKVFVFGKLKAATSNTTSGSVSWWYHVAVSYRVADQVYILDPALQPARPLTIAEWNKAVGGEKAFVKYSVCEMNTFDPGTSCDEPSVVSERQAISEQSPFFNEEWRRLIRLGRDPEQELGNNPPWLQH